MKHDRSPALNRFETELQQAVDARAARSAARRHARLVAFATLLVLGLVASAGYAWTRDPSTRVATSAPDQSVTTTTVPVTVADRTADTLAIERAAAAAIMGEGTDDPDLFIDHPEGLKETRDALAAMYPEQVGHTTFEMTSLTFTSDTEAEFVYNVLLAPPLDALPLRALVGHAVRIDGEWKVTRATACQAWSWGKGVC